MKKLSRWIVVLLLLWWCATAAFVVDETEFVVVTQFGRPVRTILEAGLQIKRPWPLESVLRYDSRMQVFETPAPTRPSDEFLTRDKKNVVVGTYTVWRIGRDEASLTRFLETMRDAELAETRLADLVVSELGATLGATDFAALATTDAGAWKWPELVGRIAHRCHQRASADYGIDIVDFQITRFIFPNQNRNAVFDRMRAERERIATRYRSEGEEEAAKIRSAARTRQTEILSQAEEEARRVRGTADAEATRIYGEAYSRDPEFYDFLRTLESYGKTFNPDTVLILSADSPYLRWLKEPPAPVPSSRPATRSAEKPSPLMTNGDAP